MSSQSNTPDNFRLAWMSDFSPGRKLLVLLTPLLLVIVALTQIVRAYTIDQSPWKGGGFGMFASVDSHGNRELRAYLVTSDYEIEIPVHYNFIIDEGGVMDDVSLARTVPTDANLQQIANQLSKFSWYLNDAETLLPQMIEAARELNGLKKDERVVLSMSQLRDIEDILNGVEEESEEGNSEESDAIDVDAPLVADKPADSTDEESEGIRVEPVRGFGPGMYESIVADIQKAKDEGKAEEENLTEFQGQHNEENRLSFTEIRVELWKGEFAGKTATYTFRLYKNVLASAAGDNLDICVDCQP
jgi:hypothetical protein